MAKLAALKDRRCAVCGEGIKKSEADDTWCYGCESDVHEKCDHRCDAAMGKHSYDEHIDGVEEGEGCGDCAACERVLEDDF